MKTVDLSERVTATYYDDEHEEWSQKTVAISDVLDSVCDDYTVIEVEPTKHGHWIDEGLVDGNQNRYCRCSECGKGDTQAISQRVPYCWWCGSRMDEVEE